MIYREYLVMRKALVWYIGVLVGILSIGVVTKLIQVTPEAGAQSDVHVDAGWIAAIFASIFGVALGNGSRDSSRVLWLLPAARWKLALDIVAVDLVGTTLAYACGYAVMLLLLVLLAGEHVHAKPWSAGGIGMALAMTYAAYGWTAVAGMLGRRIAYAGFIALPVLMIWMILAQSQDTIGSILRAPLVLNPFAVFNAGLELNSWAHHHFTLDPTASSLQWLGTLWATPILTAIAVATCGLAVALWQRAEVLN